MDTILLTVVKSKVEARWDQEPRDVVAIFINGRDLIDIVRDVELPMAQREGSREIAGSYEPMWAEAFFAPSRQLLGEPHEWFQNNIWEHEDKIVLFRCGDCGIDDCWPLVVKITLQDDTVSWSEFEHPRRCATGPGGDKVGPWEYDKLGPFVFDRMQYEAELARLGA